ncbi:MAG TPA: CapA family protein [Ruminococcus sp.]|nr:CapA family protein [Ruminococcus sp.]
MGVKVLIAADIVPTKTNEELFVNGDIKSLVGKALCERLKNADYIVMNLETPLTNSKSPIRKCGPCLMASPDTIKGLRSINPFFYTLANNHILDQGIEGLHSTISILNKNGISFSGVGNNVKEARKPFIVKVGNHSVGIYCCTEHEFSIATESRPGANPYDPLECFDDVRSLRQKCDYLIILYHGGKEHYRYPSPQLQRVFHKFADCGADLVVAQHTHCIGCKEEYNGSTLVYGQGNFLFDNSDSEFWQTSLMISLDLDTNEVEYIPLVKKGNAIREAEDVEKSKILKEFNTRNEEIKQVRFISEKYKEYATNIGYDYYLRFIGKLKSNIIVRGLNKITSFRFIKSLYPDSASVSIENVLDCEAHRELASEVMRLLTK